MGEFKMAIEIKNMYLMIFKGEKAFDGKMRSTEE